MINPRKPIRFANHPDRPLVLVGTMPGGNLVITATYANGDPWTTPMVFDNETGKPLDPSCSLTIENAPVLESGYYPLRPGPGGEPYGRGLISLSFVKDQYQTAKHFVEIIRQDDVPIDAKIHAR